MTTEIKNLLPHQNVSISHQLIIKKSHVVICIEKCYYRYKQTIDGGLKMDILSAPYLFPNSIEEIDEFSGKDFEEFLFHFFKVMGFDPRITNDSDDKGVDLMIKRSPSEEKRLIGIQAKRWKGSVTPDEIRKMLDGKNHYNLEELWIITTSKLTSSARTTALNNDITIYSRDRVIDFINKLKKKDNIFFRPSRKQIVRVIEENIEVTDNDFVIQLKTLRKEISEKHKLFPIYNVFNNEVLLSIIEHKPKDFEELSKIKGLGTKKIELFGSEIVDFVNNKLVKKTKPTSDNDQKLFELLLIERTKIAKFNKMTEDDVYTDKVAGYIAKMKPRDREILAKIYGFKKENIDIYGDYLIKVITKYIIDSKVV